MRKLRLMLVTIMLVLSLSEMNCFADARTGGSVGHDEGKTIIVTILVSDPVFTWDLSTERDQSRLESLDWNLEVATEYLTKEAESWGKELSFIYDTTPGSDLLYENTFRMTMEAQWSEDMDNAEIRKYDTRNKLREAYLRTNIQQDQLLEKYQAVNIGYLFVTNTEVDSPDLRSYAFCGGQCGSIEREYICMNFFEGGWQNPPAVYAHEILHLFGAFDLYQTDEYEEEYAKLILDHFTNDIMYSCGRDLATSVFTEQSYLEIDSEISQLTAYYLGWTDEYPVYE